MTGWQKPDWTPRVPDGSRILVAGASGGIGRATVEMLSAQGNTVIGAHGRDAGKLPTGDGIIPLAAELDGDQAARDLIDGFVQQAGGIDGLVVLTGGIDAPLHWRDMSEDNWRRDIELNLSQQFFLARAALAAMGDGPGRIVLNGTESAPHGGGATSLAYGVAKHGVECLVKGLARDAAKHHITVNGIRFGYIDSGFHSRWQDQTEDGKEQRIGMIPLGRAGTVEEAAGLITYLLSDYGAFMTGQMISLAGGDWL